jgi:flagellar hook-basal body complex protein FliE
MSISGISGVGALWPASSTPTVGSGAPTAPTAATPAAGTSASSGSGGGFAGALGSALDSVSASQGQANSLAEQAATGGLTNVQDYMVAAEQANLQTQLTVAVRNNAVQAFQQIMGMQL